MRRRRGHRRWLNSGWRQEESQQPYAPSPPVLLTLFDPPAQPKTKWSAQEETALVTGVKR